MNPKLPTDEDTNALFDRVIDWLCDYLGYSGCQASELARKHYTLFTNVDYCEKNSVPVQEDDDFHHQAAGGIALRIHFCWTLKGGPSYAAFVEWRMEYDKIKNIGIENPGGNLLNGQNE